VFAGRTRFIPAPLLKHFDRQTWPEAESEPQRTATDGPRVDLQARMRAMWR
jgi:DNA helicase II / ATP-dependent DNA helicase PcrA